MRIGTIPFLIIAGSNIIRRFKKVKRKVTTSSHVIYSNLEFLFKLNREKNNQKKSDFFRETNISRQALGKWKQGSIPARTTLNRIVDYFNNWLKLNLTPDDLLNKDLKKYLADIKVKEPDHTYLNESEKQLINHFRRLNKKDQELILSLIKRLLK